MKTSMAAPKPTSRNANGCAKRRSTRIASSNDRYALTRECRSTKTPLTIRTPATKPAIAWITEGDRGYRCEDERDAGDDEDRREDPAKPSARHDRRVGPGSRRAHPPQTRERQRRQTGREKAGAQRGDERVRLVRARQQLDRTVPIVRGQRPAREPLGNLDGVDQAFLGAKRAKSPDLAGREEEDHKDRVEDRGRRLEEVVVVTRHELPERWRRPGTCPGDPRRLL